jgi:hypothetical protein
LTITSDDRIAALPPSAATQHPAGLARWILLLALLTFLGAMIIGFRRSKLWMRPQLKGGGSVVRDRFGGLGGGMRELRESDQHQSRGEWDPGWQFQHFVLTGTLGNQQRVTRETISGNGDPVGSTLNSRR